MEAVIEELNFYISGQFCLEWYLQSCFMKPESGFHFPTQSPKHPQGFCLPSRFLLKCQQNKKYAPSRCTYMQGGKLKELHGTCPSLCDYSSIRKATVIIILMMRIIKSVQGHFFDHWAWYIVTTFATPSIFHGSDFDFENVSSGSTPHHGAPTSLAPWATRGKIILQKNLWWAVRRWWGHGQQLHADQSWGDPAPEANVEEGPKFSDIL